MQCEESRDSFALKQVMILLMTYYVNHRGPTQEVSKLYIINFFKKDPLWREIEYWESILIECIYLEKKNTINAIIVGSNGISSLTQATSIARRNSSKVNEQLSSTRC